ncbi:amidohydrolase family protein [Pseudoalteromonas luteoviolacea]|uniref:Amidohydrolase-related domain-containing protein n=1 Tax=Pseudoalteromonas luteoviolacea NCIMB 1942 TaxID=1365253 RepID=A0A166XN50_9GAMM|nr:amidohydrolase family protein [Pseudoalteromonas luteoviolacea]KZN40619.1 hypothetical protein N482_21050 [Pseudoalteromonas luteoviolacea NCIMB 1942]
MTQKVHDSDRHVTECPSLWKNYLTKSVFEQCPVELVHDDEKKAKDRMDKFGARAAVPLPPAYYVNGKPALSNWDLSHQVESAYKSGRSQSNRNLAKNAEGQLEAMQSEQVTSASLFPTFATFIINNENVPNHISVEFAKAYNRWILDYCQDASNQLDPVAKISRADSTTLVEQVELALSQGFRSVTIRPEVIAGKAIHHDDYKAFWHACAANDLPVSFHGGTHAHLNTCGTERYTDHFSLHACSHAFEAQKAFISLVGSGILASNPKLKIAFLEAGCSWLPNLLFRLDNLCAQEFKNITNQSMKMLPSEYFKRNCWVGVELDEPSINDVISLVGADKLLYGTDFPHPDHHESNPVNSKLLQSLTYEQQQQLLYKNAEQFFNFKSNIN